MYKSYHNIALKAIIASTILMTTACGDEEAKAVTTEVAKEAVSAAKVAVEKTASAATEAVKASASAAAVSTEGFSDKVKAAVGPKEPKPTLGGSMTYDFNSKKTVDGGVYYPIANGKTGNYYANEKAHADASTYGRATTPAEEKAWDIDVMPDGTGLPEGEGSVEDGEEIYDEKCASCHGDFGSGSGLYPVLARGNAYEAQKSVKNQRTNPEMDGPIRVFGAYWPYASTAWWYIKTAMPHQAPMSLTDDEVYALVAYMLYINELEIDGELVDDEYVLNREKFLKIKMPNVDGFEPDVNGPNGQENARKYYHNVLNYGNGKRCMKDCFEGEAKVQTIVHALKDFEPPLSIERSLPPKKEGEGAAAHPGKAGYEKSCGMCHDSGAAGAPITGDKAQWDKLLEGGLDAIYANAINGKGGMPPKGGAMSASDADIKAMVDYMLEKSK